MRSFGRPLVLVVLHIWLTVVILCGCARAARAQTCHMTELGARAADRLRIAGRALFATYRAPEVAGEYQGYFAAASYANPWFFAEAQLPYYRLVRDGAVERGPGDLVVDLRGTLWRPVAELAFGLELAASVPTGDAHRGLGMGHVMLMPGAWLGWERDALRVFAQLAYGRMAGDAPTGHHHHGGPGPLVNPMNRSEIEHAFAVTYAFSEHLFAGGRLLGAVPVAHRGGRAREIAGLALGARFAPLEIGAEVQLPLVGSPFTARTVLTLAALF